MTKVKGQGAYNRRMNRAFKLGVKGKNEKSNSFRRKS